MRTRQLGATAAAAAMGGLLIMLQIASPAAAKTGVGDLLHGPLVNRVVRQEPLRHYGSDAVRVTYLPFQRAGWSVELHTAGSRGAVGSISFHQGTSRGDVLVGWLREGMRPSDYGALLADIDAALARGDPPEFNAEKPGEMIICSDPDTYIVERRKHGKTTWLREDCGYNAPARDVVYRMVDAFPFPLCWFGFIQTDSCATVRAPHQDQ